MRCTSFPQATALTGDGRSGAVDDAARLRSLLDIARVIGSTRRFEDLVELSAESARRALDAAALSISRWDRESGVLRTLVNVGLLGPGEQRFPEDETYSLGDWPAMTALVEDRRVLRLRGRRRHARGRPARAA